MTGSKLLQEITKKGSDKEKLADKVIKKPELIQELLEGLNSDKADIKYGSEKVLRIISEKKPEILYDEIDLFIDLLDSKNSFLKWGAILTIANLASVDSKKKIEKIFDKYFESITGEVMITASNIVKSAAKIAIAKPNLVEKIVKELLKVERAHYKTAECKNVVLGHTILAFNKIFPRIKDKEPVVKLVKKQLKNPRNATKKKAEAFIKKYQI